MRVFVFVLVLVINFSLNAQELITPIPQEIPHDVEKARLGQKLFFDTILSYDRTISCESCHKLSKNITGADVTPTSMGIHRKFGSFNSPTVLNSVLNYTQFWDGRAKSLQEQATGPLHSKIEMGMTDKLILHRLRSHEGYNYKFNKLYDDGVTVENLVDAIVEFEKTLITPNSRFDQYLKGDKNTLSKNEEEGYKVFKSAGCITCHNGVNIGGNMIQNFGIFADLNIVKNSPYSIDSNSPKNFKVPSLRNVSKTAPYFHDGRVKDLKEAIDLMSGYQLGRELSQKEKDLIYEFLLTLEGEIPKTIYVAK